MFEYPNDMDVQSPLSLIETIFWTVPLLTFSQAAWAAPSKEGIIENKDCCEKAREDVETNNKNKELSHIVMI